MVRFNSQAPKSRMVQPRKNQETGFKTQSRDNSIVLDKTNETVIGAAVNLSILLCNTTLTFYLVLSNKVLIASYCITCTQIKNVSPVSQHYMATLKNKFMHKTCSNRY